MDRAQNIMFELLRYMIGNVPLSDETKRGVDEDTLRKIYWLSKSHDIAHLLAEGLRQNGLLQKGTETAVAFHRAQQMAVYRYEQMQYEAERIYEALEDAKIPYMPLKGAVLRSYYPEPWMRTSCDIDILVKEKDLSVATKALETVLDYNNKGDFSHDISLFSENGVHLELHYDLIEEKYMPLIAKRLENVWERVELVGSFKYRYCVHAEIFYFYHVAHMAKHFVQGGCGARPVLDVWLLDNKLQYDEVVVNEMLKDAGLLKFCNEMRRLSKVWFSGEKGDDLTEELEEYILRGGLYGNIENKIAVERKRGKSRFKYVLSCIFHTYDEMASAHPILKKHKWLYPFFQVRRWVVVLFRGVSKRTKKALKVNREITKEREDSVAGLLLQLEL